MGKMDIDKVDFKELMSAKEKGFLFLDGDYIIPFVGTDDVLFYYVEFLDDETYTITGEWYHGTEADAEEEANFQKKEYPEASAKGIKFLDRNSMEYILE